MEIAGFLLIPAILFICVASRPPNSERDISPSKNVISQPHPDGNGRGNLNSVDPLIRKSKQAVLLSGMEKLRRIKHNRNRRLRMDIIAARKALLTRQQQGRNYMIKPGMIKPGKRTRKQVRD